MARTRALIAQIATRAHYTVLRHAYRGTYETVSFRDSGARGADRPRRPATARRTARQSDHHRVSHQDLGVASQHCAGFRLDPRVEVRLQANTGAAEYRIHRSASRERRLLLLQQLWRDERNAGARGY